MTTFSIKYDDDMNFLLYAEKIIISPNEYSNHIFLGADFKLTKLKFGLIQIDTEQFMYVLVVTPSYLVVKSYENKQAELL